MWAHSQAGLFKNKSALLFADGPPVDLREPGGPWRVFEQLERLGSTPARKGIGVIPDVN